MLLIIVGTGNHFIFDAAARRSSSSSRLARRLPAAAHRPVEPVRLPTPAERLDAAFRAVPTPGAA